MKTVVVGLILVVLLGSSALAQQFVVPGGGTLPDGSVRFTIPVGVPFSVQHSPWRADRYGTFVGSPLYWIAYPYISVPTGNPYHKAGCH